LDPKSLLSLAGRAADAAGAAILSTAKTLLRENVHATHPADLLASAIIKEMLSSSNLPIMDEEGETLQPEGFCWIVDPLDGSINALSGSPDFAVSIALVSPSGEPHIGVVHAPALATTYSAGKGMGLSINGNLQRPPENAPLERARIVAFGVPDDSYCAPSFAATVVHECAQDSIVTRQCGSAALDLSRTSASVWDCYIQDGLYLWDFAAAQVCILEAGGSFCKQMNVRRGKGGNPKYRVLALAPGISLPLALQAVWAKDLE